MVHEIPRLVIAGTSSGVGKTTVAAAVIAALRARGLRVQAFKAGPDYIDPSHLGRAAGSPARNLDSWMLPPAALREVFHRAAAGADIAVVEGVMGLFDGRTGGGEAGSTAEIAKLLAAPVVVVLDIAKAGRSVAATALGFREFDRALRLAGFVLNRAGSRAHAELAASAVEQATGLPVLGALHRDAAIAVEERHLGLVPEAEDPRGTERDAHLAAAGEAGLDLDALLALARGAPPLEEPAASVFPATPRPLVARLAVARDRAFSFYYPENLDLLEACGLELVPFSPLGGSALPDGVDGLYLGGGFPELYAAELAGNGSMVESIRAAVAAGMPVLAECGGLMYLSQAIVDQDGRRHAMVGAVPGSCIMEDRRVRLGYVTVRARARSLLLRPGEEVRGHEFHWSRLDTPPEEASAAFLVPGPPERLEGFALSNLLASYVHFHFAAHPRMAERFVRACSRWRAPRRRG